MTKIEWTDETWNPIRGCSRVSEGCRNCYAEKVAYRFSGPGQPYEGLVRVAEFDHSTAGLEVKTERRLPLWNGSVKFVEEHLLNPLRWKGRPIHDATTNNRVGFDKGLRIFVNSMSDLFHENVTDEMRDRIFAVMALCPQHTFQVLTKRPKRMLAYLVSACGRIADLVMKMRKERGDRGCVGPLPHIAPGAPWWPLANVWLGVSVEDQKSADERIPLLLQTPAAVRFISAEPLLGSIDLTAVPRVDLRDIAVGTPLLHWVIAGGESGPGARPMHPDWARSLRDQSEVAGVPFFFKQWGEWIPAADHVGASSTNWGEFGPFTSPQPMRRVGKKAAGHLLDGKEYHQFPEVVNASV